MVLCDVRWSDAKDCSYGDCKNCTDVLMGVGRSSIAEIRQKRE